MTKTIASEKQDSVTLSRMDWLRICSVLQSADTIMSVNRDLIHTIPDYGSIAMAILDQIIEDS